MSRAFRRPATDSMVRSGLDAYREATEVAVQFARDTAALIKTTSSWS